VESGLLLLWNFNEFLWLIQKDRERERERENVEGYTNKRTECLRTMKGRIKGKNK
jgi:hypothetical protein